MSCPDDLFDVTERIGGGLMASPSDLTRRIREQGEEIERLQAEVHWLQDGLREIAARSDAPASLEDFALKRLEKRTN
jgi:hypothetical protein